MQTYTLITAIILFSLGIIFKKDTLINFTTKTILLIIGVIGFILYIYSSKN